jgi:TonB family protein
MSASAGIALWLLFQEVPPESRRPQAYVPMLMPLEYSQAHYPDAAVADRLEGAVEVLLKIDPEGRPVQVEALNGPDVLRRAAEQAVRQQRYRPVIRDGKPVYALTNAVVPFLPPGPRTAELTTGFDRDEQIAAGRRLHELRTMYSRSPAQVLADFEQDAGGDIPKRRARFLHRLAKAAMDAGEIDKAKAYAEELLASKPDGEGIHDGNIVLGRVALRHHNVAEARQYLLSAGRTPGGPMLEHFGPNMALAKELIEAGQRDAVLQYFDLCRTFWKADNGKLDEWTADVREGRAPKFGANLVY